MAETSTCTNCGGDGFIDGIICETCYGCGSLPVLGLHAILKKKVEELGTKIDDISDNCNNILDKCNDIFEVVTES